MTEWAAPRAHSPVRATIALPGSKSLTNRLLVLAALADGPSHITAPLRARDTELMADALRALGTTITDAGDDWHVTPGPLHGGVIDTGLAGTVMRFVPPLAALAQGNTRFDGDPYARERPMSTLLDGLRQAGVQVEDGARGRMPFTVVGTGSVAGGRVTIDSSASSQFVSGLLLAGTRYDKGIEVVHTGADSVPSQPHIDMTLDVLRQVGLDAGSNTPGSWYVAAADGVEGHEWVVEPDLSNSAPFLAAALITGGAVTIARWPSRTTQAGDALRGLLARMGARVSLDSRGLTVTAGAALHGLTADLHDVGELTPTIAVLAALATTPSHLSGIGHLRGHETDRLAAIATELTRLGCAVREEPDALTITPAPLHPATWHSYADHRMGTAGAVLGLAIDGVRVDDIACTTKTLPDFPGMWARMLGA